MIWLSWVWRNPLVRALGAALAAIAAVLLYGSTKKREGAQEAKQEMADVDRKKADGVRERVDAVRRDPVRVRPDDKRGYRD